MADLAQKVKYTIEVDTSDLTKWKTDLDTALASMVKFDDQLKQLNTSGLAAAKGIGAYGRAMKKAVDPDMVRQLEDLLAAQMRQANLINKVGDAFLVLNEVMTKNKALNNSVTASLREKVKEEKKHAEAIDKTTQKTKEQGMQFLKLFGKFQAVKWIAQQTFAALKDGAETVDIDRTLTKQLGDYTKTLEAAKNATAGVVTESQLKRDMALMSSFGLDMNRFSESMELVQKMAIRTGQSADYLSQSFARGISRLSPLILDNLGIQVSLKEANEAYAKSVGKTSESLTKNERITALMNHTLDKLRKNTEGIDLEDSAAGSVARFENFFKDIWTGIKEIGGNVIQGLDSAFASSASHARRAAKEMEPTLKVLREIRDLQELVGGNKATRNLVAGEEGKQAALEVGAKWTDALSLIDDGLINTQEQIENTFRKMADGSKITKANLGAMEMLVLQGATTEVYKALAEFDRINKGVLSDKQRQVLEENMIRETTAEVLGLLIQAETQYALNNTHLKGGNRAFATMLLNMGWLVREADTFGGSLAIAKNQALLLKNLTAAQEMVMGKLRLQVTTMVADYERAAELAEGKSVNEIQMEATMKRQSDTLAAIAKEQELYNKELEDGIATSRLDDIRKLASTLENIGIQREFWRERTASEKAYLAGFEKSSKAQKNAEITRLKIHVAQLTALLNQVKAASIMASFMPLGTTAVDLTAKDIADQIANMEAMANKLAAMDFTGGDKDPKSPKSPKFKYRDWWDDAFDDEAMREQMQKVKEASDSVIVPELKRIRLTWTPDKSGDIMGILGIDPDAINDAKENIKNLEREFNMLLAMDKNRGNTEGQDAFFAKYGLDAASIAAMNDELAPMVEHLKMMGDASAGLESAATALDNIAGGMNKLFGQDINAMVSDLSSGMQQMAEAFKANSDAYGQALGAIPAVRAFTKNLIDNRRAQAGIEAAMQTAAAWAAFATFNYPAAAAHSVAALMYFGVAGGAFRLPKGKMKDEKAGNNNQVVAKRPDIYIEIKGPIATTEAERGAMIRDALNAAQRAGI